MKLNRVEIKNYRSIKDTTVNFKPACRGNWDSHDIVIFFGLPVGRWVVI